MEMNIQLPGMDLGCGGESLEVTAEQQLDRIPKRNTRLVGCSEADAGLEWWRSGRLVLTYRR